MSICQELVDFLNNAEASSVAKVLSEFVNEHTNDLYEGSLSSDTVELLSGLVDDIDVSEYIELNNIIRRLLKRLDENDKKEDVFWGLLKDVDIGYRKLVLLTYINTEFLKKHTTERTFHSIETYLLFLRIPGNNDILNTMVLRSCMNTLKTYAAMNIKHASECLMPDRKSAKRNKKRSDEGDSDEEDSEGDDPFDTVTNVNRDWLLQTNIHNCVYNILGVMRLLFKSNLDLDNMDSQKTKRLSILAKHYISLGTHSESLQHTIETVFDCSRVAVMSLTNTDAHIADAANRVGVEALKTMRVLAMLNAHGRGAYGLGAVLKTLLPFITAKGVVISTGPSFKATVFMRNRAVEFIKSMKSVYAQDQARISLILSQQISSVQPDEEEDVRGVMTMDSVTREVNMMELEAYRQDYYDELPELRRQLENMKNEDAKRSRYRHNMDDYFDDDELDMSSQNRVKVERDEEVVPKNMGMLMRERERMMKQRKIELIQKRRDLLGLTVYETIITFLKHVTLSPQDKAPLRKFLIEGLSEIIDVFPSCLLPICHFLGQLSLIGKSGNRLQAVELSMVLLKSRVLFQATSDADNEYDDAGRNIDLLDDSDDEEMYTKKKDKKKGRGKASEKEEENVNGEKSQNTVLNMPSADVTAAPAILLQILISRISDKASNIRTKALSCLSECISLCITTKNPVLNQQFHTILNQLDFDSLNTSTFNTQLNFGSSSKPDTSVVDFDGLDNNDVNDSFLSSMSLPQPTVNTNTISNTESLGQTPFHPANSGIQHLLKLLRYRVCDSKTHVRKSALEAALTLLTSEAMYSLSNDDGSNDGSSSNERYLDYLHAEDLMIMFDGSRDIAAINRRSSIGFLEELYSCYSNDIRICELFLGAVIPLCQDVDSGVADRAISSLLKFIIMPLSHIVAHQHYVRKIMADVATRFQQDYLTEDPSLVTDEFLDILKNLEFNDDHEIEPPHSNTLIYNPHKKNTEGKTRNFTKTILAHLYPKHYEKCETSLESILPHYTIFRALQNTNNEMNQHLSWAFASILQKSEDLDVINTLVQLVNNGIDVNKSKVFWILAEQVSVLYPYLVRTDVMMAAFIEVGSIYSNKGVVTESSFSGHRQTDSRNELKYDPVLKQLDLYYQHINSSSYGVVSSPLSFTTVSTSRDSSDSVSNFASHLYSKLGMKALADIDHHTQGNHRHEDLVAVNVDYVIGFDNDPYDIHYTTPLSADSDSDHDISSSKSLSQSSPTSVSPSEYATRVYRVFSNVFLSFSASKISLGSMGELSSQGGRQHKIYYFSSSLITVDFTSSASLRLIVVKPASPALLQLTSTFSSSPSDITVFDPYSVAQGYSAPDTSISLPSPEAPFHFNVATMYGLYFVYYSILQSLFAHSNSSLVSSNSSLINPPALFDIVSVKTALLQSVTRCIDHYLSLYASAVTVSSIGGHPITPGGHHIGGTAVAMAGNQNVSSHRNNVRGVGLFTWINDVLLFCNYILYHYIHSNETLPFYTSTSTTDQMKIHRKIHISESLVKHVLFVMGELYLHTDHVIIDHTLLSLVKLLLPPSLTTSIASTSDQDDESMIPGIADQSSEPHKSESEELPSLPLPSLSQHAPTLTTLTRNVPMYIRVFAFNCIGKNMLRNERLMKDMLVVFVSELDPTQFIKEEPGIEALKQSDEDSVPDSVIDSQDDKYEDDDVSRDVGDDGNLMMTPTKTSLIKLAQSPTSATKTVQNENVVLRNNILLILYDCVRVYTNHMNNYITNLSLCLIDRDPHLRQYTIHILSQLLLEDYIKLYKGTLFFRLTRNITDANIHNRQLVKQFLPVIVKHIQVQTNSVKIDQYFLESLFYFNNCTIHPNYNQYMDVVFDVSGPESESDVDHTQHDVFKSVKNEHEVHFTLTSQYVDHTFPLDLRYNPKDLELSESRREIYRYLLTLVTDDVVKIKIINKLVKDVIGELVTNTLSNIAFSGMSNNLLESSEDDEDNHQSKKRKTFTSDLVTNRLVLFLADKRRENNGMSDSNSSGPMVTLTDYNNLLNVIQDALIILLSPHLKLNKLSEDDDENTTISGEGNASVAVESKMSMAKLSLIIKLYDKDIIENQLPIMIECIHILKKLQHPMVVLVLEYISNLVSDHRTLIDSIEQNLRDDVLAYVLEWESYVKSVDYKERQANKKRILAGNPPRQPPKYKLGARPGPDVGGVGVGSPSSAPQSPLQNNPNSNMNVQVKEQAKRRRAIDDDDDDDLPQPHPSPRHLDSDSEDEEENKKEVKKRNYDSDDDDDEVPSINNRIKKEKREESDGEKQSQNRPKRPMKLEVKEES